MGFDAFAHDTRGCNAELRLVLDTTRTYVRDVQQEYVGDA